MNVDRSRDAVDRPRRAPWATWLLLALLILFHLFNNWLWRQSNEVVFAFDRMFHQVTSLAYYDILRQGLTLPSLFAALTWSDYYPPLVHLTAAGFYALFGVSMDVAAMSNSLYLVTLLLAVYALGRRLAGPWIGLLAAFVVSTLPIVFSMSRYLYVDFALTAMVALNLCLLLHTERFSRKGYSLLYGLSLGLGMLTKWTFAAFVAVPLLLVLASPGLIRAVVQVLHPRAWRWRRLAIAALLGLGLTALWFLPNVQATAALPLGYGLLPLSCLIWSLTCYFGLASGDGAEPVRGANLLAALGLGLALASAWYLTKINFLGDFMLNAYGKSTGRSWGFGPYLDFLFREQLSPLLALLVLVALLGLAWSRWRRVRGQSAGAGRAMLALGLDGWVLVLWVLVPYVVFSSQVSIIHSRYIMPLLPPLGIALALWLGRLRPRWFRALLTLLLVAGALFQFAALSYDALAGLQERLPLLADGLSIQLPASGRTDPGYWVVPDILDDIEAQRDTDPARLGVLVNKPQVNSKHFIYLAYADYPHVQIDELAAIGRSNPAYPRLYEQDFVLLIDPPPDYVRRPDTSETIEQLLTDPDDSFHRAFTVAGVYPLPDDTRLILYRRRFALSDVDPAYAAALLADLQPIGQPGDAVVVMPPELIYALARHGDGSLAYYPFPAQAGTFSEADAAALLALGGGQERLWLVLADPAGEPESAMVRWLDEFYYRAGDAWFGSLLRLLYAPAPAGEGDEFQAAAGTWQNGISLAGVRFLDQLLPPGGILRLDLLWQAAEPLPERYKVFVHLLAPDGRLVSQRDSEPAAGLRPTTIWASGDLVADRYGLWLPPDLAPGDYRLLLGLYHADSGERVPACCPEADALLLATLYVEAGQARVVAASPGP